MAHCTAHSAASHSHCHFHFTFHWKSSYCTIVIIVIIIIFPKIVSLFNTSNNWVVILWSLISRSLKIYISVYFRVHGWKYVHRGGKWEWLICDAKTAHIWKLESNLNTCFSPCNKFILSTMMYLTWKGRPEQLYRPEWTLFCPWELLTWPERE